RLRRRPQRVDRHQRLAAAMPEETRASVCCLMTVWSMLLAKLFQDAQPIGGGVTSIWLVLTAVGSTARGADGSCRSRLARPATASPAARTWTRKNVILPGRCPRGVVKEVFGAHARAPPPLLTDSPDEVR
ncbi:hypothetical protein, partial [Streptomyces spinoverrucosus]|uniref:hypothetical protein n=1 Tax=Streptomyces spinoverrucosus TaxID=284043 RepID=UPI001C3FBFA2